MLDASLRFQIAGKLKRVGYFGSTLAEQELRDRCSQVGLVVKVAVIMARYSYLKLRG